MGTGLIIAIIVIVLAVWFISTYNSLIAMRNRVGNGWAQIDVLLKQRADLIPNLVETIKGYAGHENRTLTEVTEARAGAVAAANDRSLTIEQRAAAEERLSRALLDFNAVAEAYPDLKADRNFLMLQDELTQLEQKIAYARQFYNDTTMKYNTRIQQFPTNLVAGMFHFRDAQYYAVEPAARAVPQVSFGTSEPPRD
ncbi:MAG: LemA family protein [Bifidobacterium sp.]|nr:LemA family protein [Bifidobacterium sp.]